VTVHLLVGGKTPENEGFLVRLRAMQPQSMAKLIEVGEYQGAMFVVTVAPPQSALWANGWRSRTVPRRRRRSSARRGSGSVRMWVR
jgi:hypothetical protein